MSFKETAELNAMETTIAEAEERVQTLDATLNDPSFYITRSQEAAKFSDDLEAAKAEVARLYLRWDELEALRVALNV
jgi:ATP-binding cassette subfamily F protein uup